MREQDGDPARAARRNGPPAGVVEQVLARELAAGELVETVVELVGVLERVDEADRVCIDEFVDSHFFRAHRA